jgi:hypothetical protein
MEKIGKLCCLKSAACVLRFSKTEVLLSRTGLEAWACTAPGRPLDGPWTAQGRCMGRAWAVQAWRKGRFTEVLLFATKAKE